jgi:hypothetical protein
MRLLLGLLGLASAVLGGCSHLVGTFVTDIHDLPDGREEVTLCTVYSQGSAGFYTDPCTKKTIGRAPSPSPVDPRTARESAVHEAGAVQAIDAWLVVVDEKSYADSWIEASTQFRKAIDQPGWTQALSAMRGQVGALRSRTVRSVRRVAQLPRAPTGEYVVVEYVTSFYRKPQAAETVTATRENDGSWRVSGYSID